MAVEQAAVVVQAEETPFLAPGQQADGTISTRPEGLPEQFWDATKGEVRMADFTKAYADLASKAPKEETPAATTTTETPAAEVKPEDKPADKPADGTGEVADFLADTGLNMDELGARFSKDGKLSDEDYAALAKKGVTKEFADQVAAGQIALAEAATRRIHAAAGGEENMNRMFTWAASGLDAAKIDELNKAFESRDVAAAEVAMGTLKGLYEKANGREPDRRVGGGAALPTEPAGYQSWAEVTRDMGKPEYRDDPAFRARVQQKLGASKL